MIPRVSFLVSLFLLAGCARQALRVDPAWTGSGLPEYAVGSRVRVRSDLPETTAMQTGEEFARAVDRVAAVLGLPVPEQLALLVVRRASSGVPERRAIGGLVMPHGGTRVVLTVGDRVSLRAREVIRHEAVHWLLMQTHWIERAEGTRWPGIPRWLDEGLATSFEMGSTGTEDNRPRREEFERLAAPQWRGLLGLKRTLALPRGKPMSSADYARSWAICSYLLREHPAKLAELLRRRAAWCRQPQPERGLREHEERLHAISRQEFDDIVLDGRSLDGWFDQVCAGLVETPDRVE